MYVLFAGADKTARIRRRPGGCREQPDKTLHAGAAEHALESRRLRRRGGAGTIGVKGERR